MIRRVLILLATAPFFVAGCSGPPKADPEDVAIRDQWAAKVPQEVRDHAIIEINRHPGWGERRRLAFEVSEYKKYLKDEDRKSRIKRPTTRGATTKKSSASPAPEPSSTTAPTTRSSRRSTTRRAATSPTTAPAQ